MTIDRRATLALLGGGAALGLGGVARAGQAGDARFLHGVASGDPASDGAVIWTRASVADEREIMLAWHIALEDGARTIRSGKAAARAAADHTVKIEVDGLKPGARYRYWFTTPAGTRSPEGRFRTLPVGRVDRLVIGVASCQLWPGGLFNAFADMAMRPELDVVLHLGDYIYEYGPDGFGANIGRELGRLPDPPHETVTLADYRRRHAQVKTDPDLQAAHARAAFICVWDDHEIANDSWIDGAENHDPETQGDWRARKAAAMQAYFEWMPIRDPRPGHPVAAIHRSFEFGDLATLAMLETRLLARSEQVAPKGATPGPELYRTLLTERARPERELMGAAQKRWLERTLAASATAGKPWQLIGSQVVMARVAGPDLAKALGPQRYAETLARIHEGWRPRIEEAQAGYRAGLPFNLEGWDGYAPARERLYDGFAAAGSHPIVLSGDSHAAWANDLRDDTGRLAATEFGATAITSPSYGSLLPGLGAVIADQNSEVAFCDQDAKGYTLLTLTPAEAMAEFVTVSTVLRKPFERSIAARCRVPAGRTRSPVEVLS